MFMFQEDEEGMTDDEQSFGDIDMLQHQIRQRQSGDEARSRNASGSSAFQSNTRPGSQDEPQQGISRQLPVEQSTPTPAKIPRVLGKRTITPQESTSTFQAAAAGFLQQMSEKHNAKGNEHTNFAIALADDLNQIRSRTRVLILKNRITNLVHEALMAEIPVSDEDI